VKFTRVRDHTAVECDQEGQAVFPASKFLRSLKVGGFDWLNASCMQIPSQLHLIHCEDCGDVDDGDGDGGGGGGDNRPTNPPPPPNVTAQALDVSSCNVKHMRFSVLGLAFSACDFSAASMGDDKFRAARWVARSFLVKTTERDGSSENGLR
jgi:hypothetical protein